MPDHLTRPEETLVLKGSHRGGGGSNTEEGKQIKCSSFEAGANVSGRNSQLHQSIIRVGTMGRAWKCCHLPRRTSFVCQLLHRVGVAGGSAQTSTLLTVCKRCSLAASVQTRRCLHTLGGRGAVLQAPWQPARSRPHPQSGTSRPSQCDVVFCPLLSARVG